MSDSATLKRRRERGLTDNHCRELEAFPDTLPVDLIRKVGETDVAHEFFADDRRQAWVGESGCRPICGPVHGGIVAVGCNAVVVRHVLTTTRSELYGG